MRIPLLVRGRGLHASSADRLVRFRKVLKSAQRSTFHHHSLRSAGLDTARSIQRLQSIEEALPRLAVCDRNSVSHSRHTACRPASAILNPLPGNPKISMGITATGAPEEILAGTFAALRSFAGKVTVERALIVLTGVHEGVLTASNRDWLWNAFGVPMFEQCLGFDGQLIALECEVHEGLHIVQQNAVMEGLPQGDLLLTSLTDLKQPTLRLKTGISGKIETKECDCGRSGPRVMDLGLSTDMR